MNQSTVADSTITSPSRATWSPGETTVPAANIFSRQDEYVIELEMPGVTRQGLEISIEGNQLTVVGRRQAAETPGRLIYSETDGGQFRRSFELSTDIDTEKIHADLHQGVLCLHLPRAERAKPRKITIE